MIECPLLRKIWEEALEDLYYDPVMNFEALRILKEIEEAIRAQPYKEVL